MSATDPILWYQGATLILTNLLYALPAFYAFITHRYLHAFILQCIVIFSSLYHACQYATSTHCPLALSLTRSYDYATALLVLPLIGVILIPFGPIYTANNRLLRHAIYFIEHWIIYLYFITVALELTIIGGVPSIGFLIFYCVSTVAMVLLGWLHFRLVFGRWPMLKRREFLIATVLFICGTTIFILEDLLIPASWRWLSHSTWHVIGALGLLYLLRSRSASYKATRLGLEL